MQYLMVGADMQPCLGAVLCALFSHQTTMSSVSPLSWQHHQSKQMLVHPPPNRLLAAPAWMTWTSWARHCCSSLCLQNLNKCDGKHLVSAISHLSPLFPFLGCWTEFQCPIPLLALFLLLQGEAATTPSAHPEGSAEQELWHHSPQSQCSACAPEYFP